MLNVNSLGHPLNPNDLVTLDDLTISSMWEIAAPAELLERTGILSNQEVLAMVQELRQREPTAIPPRRLSSSEIAAHRYQGRSG